MMKKKALEHFIPIYFDEANAPKRISFFVEHSKNKLLNSEFIKTYIDLHLTRENSPQQWSLAIAQLTGISAKQLAFNLMKNIQQPKKRKRYILPQKKEAILSLINSLKGNRR